MTKEQAIEQCRKIYELVKRGIGGEQESAKQRLTMIMGKYGIQMHDIEGEEIVWDSFKCIGKDQQKMAIQIIASVLGGTFASYKNLKQYHFKAPLSKVSEIKDRWVHYIELWEKEVKAFRSAFIQKHKLYKKPEKDDIDDDKPLTPEEKEKLMRMFQLMEAMEHSDYKKKLSHTK